jgi:hypothetical protein
MRLVFYGALESGVNRSSVVGGGAGVTHIRDRPPIRR